MTRAEILTKLYEMAKTLSQVYTYEMMNQMWTLCLDWNQNHEDEEIFMCDDEDEDGNYRYFIEDDYFYYAR